MKEITDFMETIIGPPLTDTANSCSSSGQPGGNNNNKCTCLNKLPLGYSYTPMQELGSLYSYSEGLQNGTMFPELNLPLGVYGNNFCKKEGK